MAIILPPSLRNQRLVSCKPHLFDVELVFSALPLQVAKEVEPLFINSQIHVCSNSAYHRLHSQYPLIVPEINLNLLKSYVCSKEKTKRGFLITNPNCVACPLSLALMPLLTQFNIKKISLVSLQSLSGAGFRTMATYDRENHIIPYIDREEEKIITETQHLLKSISSCSGITYIVTSVRVPSPVGHTLILDIDIDNSHLTVEDIKKCYINWKPSEFDVEHSSMRVHPLFVLYEEKNMPQSNIFSDLKSRMKIHIGRIRLRRKQLSMVILSDNLIRGAAGSAIMNAEYLYQLWDKK